ncbi:MAG: hypothetical protein LBS99_03175 [Clostridiales bacterium]|nr:hypothetical protein [Clostridiales bacterium]
MSELIASVDGLRAAYKNLVRLLNSNGGVNIKFALLADLPPSPDITDPRDGGFFDCAETLYSKSAYKDRIAVLFRSRTADSDGGYCGRERKRGAVMDLCALAQGERGARERFRRILGDIGEPTYLVALDADSYMNDITALIETAEHPSNAKYNVITPKAYTDVLTTRDTAFARIMAGGRGYHVYYEHNPEPEQDIFGSGIFSGKGIIRIKNFYGVLKNAFPDGRILSHDLIEGAFTGAAGSDIALYDSFPSNAASNFTRALRWLRGDWQLAPYLFGEIENGSGEIVPNPISLLDRWRIFYNMFRTVMPIAALVLSLAPLFTGAYVTALPAAAYLLLTPAVTVIRRARNILCGAKITAELKETVYCIIRAASEIALLPVVAAYNLAGIAVTVYRLTVSRRKLLSWKTFSACESAKGGFSEYVKFLFPNLIAAVVITAVAAFTGAAAYYALAAVFLISIPLCYLGGLEAAPENTAPAAPERARLRELAARTYGFFTVQHTAENNYLPCDNFQEEGGIGWIRRTSPTNIGFALLANLCAYGLELCGYESLCVRTRDILATLKKMRKWKGNLYNWYDVATLKVLPPVYVSTVDSGNLLAALVTCRAAFAASPEIQRDIDALTDGCEIEALYDARRKLFYIGTDTVNPDASHYDLMASEAMLASYLAVSLGRVPKEHFYRLSRAAVRLGGAALYSWSGGMFEYLMSALFLPVYKNTLIYGSNRGAVRAQIAFARREKLEFFGISESQYYDFDASGNLQYKAFGIERLGLRKESGQRVLSPYSAALALAVYPAAAARALSDLCAAGYSGRYGFIEAVDCREGNPRAVRSYMSHHQGMILCALTNRLNGNAIIKSFIADDRCGANRILLTEPPILKARRKTVSRAKPGIAPEPYLRIITVRPEAPEVNVLSGGKYTLVTDSAGGSFSVFDGVNLTSARPDGDYIGTRVYLAANGGVTDVDADAKRIIFSGAYTAYSGTFAGVNYTVRVSVMQNIGGEIREIRLANRGSAAVKLRVFVVSEPILNDASAHYAHPAFHNLFTAVTQEKNYIVANKTNAADKIYYAVGSAGASKFEGNKANLFRRDGGGFIKTRTDNKSFGVTLNPIAAVYDEFELARGADKNLLYPIVATRSKESIARILDGAKRADFADTVMMNASVAHLQFQAKIGGSAERSAAYARLAAAVLFPSNPNPRDGLNAAEGRARALSERSFPTDVPLVVFGLSDNAYFSELEFALRAIKSVERITKKYCFVIMFSEHAGYNSPVARGIEQLLAGLGLPGGSDKIRSFNATGEHETAEALRRFASVLYDDHFADSPSADGLTNDFGSSAAPTPAPLADAPGSGVFADEPLGIGGFMKNGDYAVDITETDTPLPWSNVIADGDFGTLITERGGGYTWFKNSRESKLTVWSNDSVCDPPSETLMIRDDDRNICWTPAKSRFGAADGEYTVMHGLGYTAFYNNYNGVSSVLREYIDRGNRTKLFALRLTNACGEARKLTACLSLKLLLGSELSARGAPPIIERKERGALAVNAHNGIKALLLTDAEDFGLSDNLAAFNAWKRGGILTPGNGIPLLSLARGVILQAGGQAEIYFALSADPQYSLAAANAERAYADCVRYYGGLSALRIETPDKTLDYMFNYRLPYQVECSRFYGRCGFYQAGGAYGFRDQLQDCLAMLYVEPSRVRSHLLLCCEHQYAEGDVQHWWHPEKYGLRTRVSDDLLFLPYVTAEYIGFTGDAGILDEIVRYLSSPPLTPKERDRYENPKYDGCGTVLEHCLKAIELAGMRVSDRGLQLMGAGDWNDAMNRVGAGGRGESIWLTMFYVFVLNGFIPYVRDRALKSELRNLVAGARESINEHGYRGNRYLRAITDNGYVLGADTSLECRIDLLPQAWAVISGVADAARAESALNACRELVDAGGKLISLLDPPYSILDAGYISEYPKGVRENGGQYTHAALWYVAALFRAGRADEGYRALAMLNPANHAGTVFEAEKYMGEPYAVSADVYTNRAYYGRAGWTYYTGSAAWMYKVTAEELLGIRIRGGKLIIKPKLPESWDGCSVVYRPPGQGVLKIKIVNRRAGVQKMTLDGVTLNADYLTIPKEGNIVNVLLEI